MAVAQPSEAQKVEQAHPGWRQAVQTPEFKSWLARQPASTKKLAGSPDARDAIALLDAYRRRDAGAGLTNSAVPSPQAKSNLATEPRGADAKAKPATWSDVMHAFEPLLHPYGNALKATNVFAGVTESVVVIEAQSKLGKSQGSGVVVGEQPFNSRGFAPVPVIVTNAHVVRGTKDVTVRVGGARVPGKVIYSDPKVDLALVTVEPIAGLRRVGLSSASKLEVGATVYAVGSPLGLENSLTSGLVSALRRRDGDLFVQTSAAISPGSSGGGLFNEKGQLVGITTFKLRGGENLNFAIDAEVVFALTRAYHAAGGMVLFVDNEQYAAVKLAWEQGDLVRWLRTAVHGPSGQQRYVQVSRILDRQINRMKSSLPNGEQLNAEIAGFVSDLTAEVPKVPHATYNELAGLTAFSCAIGPPGETHNTGATYVAFDIEGGAALFKDRTYPLSVRGDELAFIDDIGAPARWVLNRSSGQVSLFKVIASRGIRAGELVLSGACRLEP